MEKDPIICTCMEITQSQIETAIKKKNLRTIEAVQDETTAGTICGACVDEIYVLLEKINGSVEL
ncbi:MAG: (2Fe-2S)-binding protein [Bacteroidales bacterium]